MTAAAAAAFADEIQGGKGKKKPVWKTTPNGGNNRLNHVIGLFLWRPQHIKLLCKIGQKVTREWFHTEEYMSKIWKTLLQIKTFQFFVVFSFFFIALFYMEAWRQAKPADDINTYISSSHNKILCTHRLQEGNSREENTNHCGVLAAGRRKGEAHWGNQVKGILTLWQLLREEWQRFTVVWRWVSFVRSFPTDHFISGDRHS